MILPSNFESAYSKDDLNYSLAEMMAISFFRNQDINTQFENVGCEIVNQLSVETEIAKIALNILISHFDPITTGLIGSFLFQVLNGKIFGKSGEIKITIYEKENNKPIFDYEGSINGLKEVIEIFKNKTNR